MARTPEETFRYLFRPGQFYLVCGPRGSGKTTWAAHIAHAALTKQDDYAVLSNIILKRKTNGKDGSWGWEEGYPEGYHKVTSWVEVMQLLPHLLEQRRRVILAIDEVVLSVGMAAGSTVLSSDTRSVLALVTLLRKLNMCLFIIVLDESATMSRYRNVGPIVNGIWRRGVKVPGYEPHEVVQLEGSKGSHLWKFAPEGFARPEAEIGVDEYAFETTASASFSMGQLDGMPFDLMASLMVCSNCIAEEVPRRLREYLSGPSDDALPADVDRGGPKVGLPHSANPKEKRRKREGVTPEVDKLLMEGRMPSEISKQLDVSKQYVYKRRKKLAGAAA